MRRKTGFGILSAVILLIILAAFVLTQRSYRMLLLLCIFVLLVADSIVFIRQKGYRIMGIVLSLVLCFALFLCTAPGIMKPAFQAMEKLRFSLTRSVYEKDIYALKTRLSLDGEKDPGQLDHAENHLKFFANDVLIRQQKEQLMVVYVTEPDSYSGYAWVSDAKLYGNSFRRRQLVLCTDILVDYQSGELGEFNKQLIKDI